MLCARFLLWHSLKLSPSLAQGLDISRASPAFCRSPQKRSDCQFAWDPPARDHQAPLFCPRRVSIECTFSQSKRRIRSFRASAHDVRLNKPVVSEHPNSDKPARTMLPADGPHSSSRCPWIVTCDDGPGRTCGCRKNWYECPATCSRKDDGIARSTGQSAQAASMHRGVPHRRSHFLAMHFHPAWYSTGSSGQGQGSGCPRPLVGSRTVRRAAGSRYSPMRMVGMLATASAE